MAASKQSKQASKQQAGRQAQAGSDYCEGYVGPMIKSAIFSDGDGIQQRQRAIAQPAIGGVDEHCPIGAYW